MVVYRLNAICEQRCSPICPMQMHKKIPNPIVEIIMMNLWICQFLPIIFSISGITIYCIGLICSFFINMNNKTCAMRILHSLNSTDRPQMIETDRNGMVEIYASASEIFIITNFKLGKNMIIICCYSVVPNMLLLQQKENDLSVCIDCVQSWKWISRVRDAKHITFISIRLVLLVTMLLLLMLLQICSMFESEVQNSANCYRSIQIYCVLIFYRRIASLPQPYEFRMCVLCVVAT